MCRLSRDRGPQYKKCTNNIYHLEGERSMNKKGAPRKASEAPDDLG